MNAQRDLRRAFRGQVHLPGSNSYDDERVTWSKRIDPRPAMVAEALTPADVRAAVLTAQLHDLPFAVQATGHGTLVPADGGLLLKTSQMAEVLVDPERQTARVGPGARWGDVIAAAAPLGLAPISGSSTSVGVTGYTLGGGFGWLSRKLRLRRRQPAASRHRHRRRAPRTATADRTPTSSGPCAAAARTSAS